MKTPRAKNGRARTAAPLDDVKPLTTTRRSKGKRPPTGQVTMAMEAAAVEVAQLAHQLFLSRGGVHGHDLDDWLEAERQVRAVRAVPAERERTAVAAEDGRRPADLRS